MDRQTALTRFQSWMLDRRLARRTRESYLGHVHRYRATSPLDRIIPFRKSA